MPRVESSSDAGLKVVGAYRALLQLEADRFERSERIAARMKAQTGTFMRRSMGCLLERLESGEAVVVDRVHLELALFERDRPEGRVRLPLARGARRVRLMADDRVVPVVGVVDAD